MNVVWRIHYCAHRRHGWMCRWIHGAMWRPEPDFAHALRELVRSWWCARRFPAVYLFWISPERRLR